MRSLVLALYAEGSSEHLFLLPSYQQFVKDLLRLAEEVKTTKQPCPLKRDSKTVAMLMPVGIAVKAEKR